jgi:glycyl-tRNA synthetase beta chain
VRAGQALAVAERLDTLCGIFTVGLKPSGNKDPFALRRAALGLARTLIEGELDLDLVALIHESVALIPVTSGTLSKNALAAGLGSPESKAEIIAQIASGRSADATKKLVTEIRTFIIDRLRGYYSEQGFGSEIFESVRVLEPSSLVEFDRRLRAVVAFAALPEAPALASANKRIVNMLRQANFTNQAPYVHSLISGIAERDLVSELDRAGSVFSEDLASGNYLGVLLQLSTLKHSIDRFFEETMVMADDPEIRNNRLAILSNFRMMFLRVADISLLPGGPA